MKMDILCIHFLLFLLGMIGRNILSSCVEIIGRFMTKTIFVGYTSRELTFNNTTSIFRAMNTTTCLLVIWYFDNYAHIKEE